MDSYEVNGDVILAIRVPRARREDKPVYINNDMTGGTFRRNDEVEIEGNGRTRRYLRKEN